LRYIIYDLEATCWRGRPPHGINEIIEIGAYKINEFGEVLGIFNKFVKPTLNPILSDFCKSLTSITQEDINRAKTYPFVIESFQEFIDIDDDNFVLCAWGKFDVQMLKINCDLHKLDDTWLDNNINVKDQYQRIKGPLKHGGLKNTIKMEGMEFTGIHHRAIADAENLAKIFIKYIDEWVV
jgi:3'-5' exoribonuclease 1